MNINNNMQPFELGLLFCEHRSGPLLEITPLREPRLVTSQNPGVQMIQFGSEVL